MRIQYVSTYIKLSEEGLVPKLLCPQDQGSLLCNYKSTMGINKYESIVELVNGQKRV